MELSLPPPAGQGSLTVNESMCDVPRTTYLRQLLGNASLAVEQDKVPLEVSPGGPTLPRLE